MEITKSYDCLLDNDILIDYNDKYPKTIFGQVYKRNDGYLAVGSQKLHILVYEFYNGKIPSGCEVHHINFNKKDNRKENLRLMNKYEHRSLHNKGINNLAHKNKKSNLPYGFSKSDKLKNGEYSYIFQYFDNNGKRHHIMRRRIDDLVNESIKILTSLNKDYSNEIRNIKEWANNNNLGILTFKKLEKNNLPKGCSIHIRNNRKTYEFYHPSNSYLGGSINFNKALLKAIKNTDDNLYKNYLIDRWYKPYDGEYNE